MLTPFISCFDPYNSHVNLYQHLFEWYDNFITVLIILATMYFQAPVLLNRGLLSLALSFLCPGFPARVRSLYGRPSPRSGIECDTKKELPTTSPALLPFRAADKDVDNSFKLEVY